MQLAVSEMSGGSFDGYMVALTISGLILLVLAIGGFFKESKGARIFSGVVGLAFLGYAFYLFFIFTGGTVFISYYVFIVPVILIVNLFRSRKEKQQAADAQVAAASYGAGPAAYPQQAPTAFPQQAPAAPPTPPAVPMGQPPAPPTA
jgi:hypothetical protein